MHVDITIKNYRCFPDNSPARLAFHEGFTAFVGVNNSGKSSLLKFFYEFRDLFGRISSPSTNLHNALGPTGDNFSLARQVSDPEEVFSRTTNRDLTITLEFPNSSGDRPQGSPPLASCFEITVPRPTNNWRAELRAPGRIVDVRGYRYNNTILCNADGHPLADLSNLFRVGSYIYNSLYIGPFRNAINVGTNDSYFDIQVGQSFISQWRQYQTGIVRKQNEAAYKLTEDIKRIFEYDDLQINPADDGQTLQIFVNGRSFRLSELGSGLTQFILVLANAAVKQPACILIDEPELNLHPSLQLDFLTTLGSYASRGVLFATHNIGLARSTAQRIYSTVRIEEGISTVTPYEATPRLSEFLGELSYSGYRALGFDKVLLVEGSTDVTTVQQFLRLYGKDHTVVILPLGGSSLINGSSFPQLEEIKRISANVIAIIDSELESTGASLSAERIAFSKNCERAGIRCHILRRRALENYLSDRAVKVVKGENYRSLSDYERLDQVRHGWSKTENWRIARVMSREEIDQSDLGGVLKSI